MITLILLAVLGGAPSQDPEARVVEYLRANVKPGERVVVSELYNSVFTSPEDRAALSRLFNAFFKLPLFVAQYQKSAGRPPSLQEISEQFAFRVPGEAELMLRIVEADPRIPRFLRRDPASGEITGVDVDRILADPRFGKGVEHAIAGFEGTPVPPFSASLWDGRPVTSGELAGRPYALYFWFTNCPPCTKTAPLLVELGKAHEAEGLEILGVNADRVLGLEMSDADRAAYARRLGMTFPLAHMTPAMQEAFGAVSVFPTLFFVNREGTIVRHLVSAPDKASLEDAARLALSGPRPKPKSRP